MMCFWTMRRALSCTTATLREAKLLMSDVFAELGRPVITIQFVCNALPP